MLQKAHRRFKGKGLAEKIRFEPTLKDKIVKRFMIRRVPACLLGLRIYSGHLYHRLRDKGRETSIDFSALERAFLWSLGHLVV